MDVRELVNSFDDKQLLHIFSCCICPNEFDLKCFDDNDIDKCEGDDRDICPQCWEYALKSK